jgi:hypothetical protein
MDVIASYCAKFKRLGLLVSYFRTMWRALSVHGLGFGASPPTPRRLLTSFTKPQRGRHDALRFHAQSRFNLRRHPG